MLGVGVAFMMIALITAGQEGLARISYVYVTMVVLLDRSFMLSSPQSSS